MGANAACAIMQTLEFDIAYHYMPSKDCANSCTMIITAHKHLQGDQAAATSGELSLDSDQHMHEVARISIHFISSITTFPPFSMLGSWEYISC